MLVQIYARLGCSFWASFLVALYCMSDKSHLLPMAPHLFDSNKHLQRPVFIPKCFTYHHHRPETIQFSECRLEIPLCHIPNSMLCLTAAISIDFRVCGPSPRWMVIAFLISLHMSCLFPPCNPILWYKVSTPLVMWATHRGDDSFAYQLGVPIELIKALSNRHSGTILIYSIITLTVSLHSAKMLSKLPYSTTAHYVHSYH